MPELPIRRLVIYKHGVGYFERRGPASGASLRLSFPREAMDDVLKSLVALDLGAGQVLGVDFETPENRAERIGRGSIHLSDGRSLLDLLRDLRGRRVRLAFEPAESVEGVVLGVDVEDERPLRAPVVSVYIPERREVRPVPVGELERLELLDDRAAEDLAYFLRASQSEEDRRAATLRLSEGDHDLLVGYVAPAPAWRVSYRVLFETDGQEPGTKDQEPTSADSSAGDSRTPAVSRPDPVLGSQSSVLLQGWGLFDNQLDEDLEDVALTLVAGMPVSFRYRLYEPHTPERPLVEDEQRTVAAPIEFAGMVADAAPPPMAGAPPQLSMKRARAIDAMPAPAAPAAMMSLDAAESSTEAASAGEERGALFQYRVSHPVSVARGQSAMVPIVSQRLRGRKELLYNASKLPRNPVASLRTRNETGLTLERGPATVVEDGDYAGEAVLPFTRAGGELIVPYAVELGVTVTEEHGRQRATAGLSVQNEYLLVDEWEIRTTTYQIASTLAARADITVEQALLSGYELHETAAPSEQSQGVARWTVSCAPGATTRFSVRQRARTTRREQVRGLSGAQLAEYLRQRFLDQRAFDELSGVLATYARIAAANQRQRAIEQERQAIYQRQAQTQQSLGPLGRDGSEGALRKRYVTMLDELENQLGALGAEDQRLKSEIAQLEEAASRALAALTRR